MQNTFNSEETIALEILLKAILLLNQIRQNKTISYKKNNAGYNEIVTNIDIEINDFIANSIVKKFRYDLVIGEERSLNYENHIIDRMWLIDPIDGTKSFIKNKNGCSITISFVFQGSPVFSFIHNIIKNETIFVKKGEGIFLITETKKIRIHLSHNTMNQLIWNPFSKDELKEYFVRELELSSTYNIESTALRAISMVRGLGKVFFSLPRSSNIWDTAPAFLIISEIGGQYTDINGNVLMFNHLFQLNENGAVASFKMNHQEVIETLNKYILKMI